VHSLALTLAGLSVMFCPAGRLPAQETPAQILAPFVDDQTVGIIRIDATRIDDAKVRELLKALSGGNEEKGEHAEAMLAWLPPFVKAGGKELYLVVGLANFSSDPYFAIAPVPAGADAQAIKQALAGIPIFQDHVREVIGSSVFVGSKETLQHLKTLQPAQRKEVAAAFAASGDAALQIVIVPNADIRRIIEEILPTLPAELGGGSIKTLTRGILWATISMDASPATSLRFVADSENGEFAKALANFVEKNINRLVKLPVAEQLFPGLAAMAPDLTPRVTGPRLTLTLDDKKVMALLKPTARIMHESAYRAHNQNNLKRIVLALYNYYDKNKHFSAVANFDRQGKPLLSWRVHILPFLGEEKLYEEFHLNEPWDSEHNKTLIARIPAVYVVPGAPGLRQGLTTYLAPVAKDAMWTGTPKTIKLEDVTDGTSNTIFVVDAADKLATPWTKPSDFEYEPKNIVAGLAYRYGNGATGAYADGSVRSLPKNVDAKKLLAVFTRNGGEVIDW
jgi:hypothetical protein